MSLYDCFMRFQYLSKYVVIALSIIQKLLMCVVFTAKCNPTFC